MSDTFFKRYSLDGITALTDQEIKEQVIAVEAYRCRVDFNPFYEHSRESAKRQCKHALLVGLEKFVKVEVSDIGAFVEGSICVPYVYDDTLAKASKKLIKTFAKIHELNHELDDLRAAILKFNSMPWYKRLFKKVRI